MRKKFILGLVIFVFVVLVGLLIFNVCNRFSDAGRFKAEYESLNGEVSTSGVSYRNVFIGKDNPFVYKTADELVEMINNEETFIVYFGFKSCPWCRSVLPTLIDVAKDLKLKKIYYVDVYDIRDSISLDEKKEPVVDKAGSDGYMKLLELLGDVLSDYTVSLDEESVVVGKRIYAPNVVSVVKGKAKSLTTGVSSLQTDGYMKLTDEMIKETYDSFEKVLEDVVSCSLDTGC